MAGRPAHPNDSNPRAPDRFLEEAATYSVRGADAPDLHTGIAAIWAFLFLFIGYSFFTSRKNKFSDLV